MSETSFSYLLLGVFAAAGFALLIGTLAALARYKRTGLLPGMEPSDEVTPGHIRGLWVRVVIGVVLTVIGVIILVRSGLL